MRFNKAALGRHAQVVRILTDLPVLVQAKNARMRRGKKKTQKVYLPHLTIIIRYTQSGDVVIEFEPP